MPTRRNDGGNYVDLDALPRILDITTRLATYETPKSFFVGNEWKAIRRAVEITVRTESPLQARAIGPVVWIGETAIVEMEEVGPNQYRFYAFEPSRLRDGAAIAFGWPYMKQAQRIATRFRLRLGAPDVA